MTRQQAWETVCEFVQSEGLRKHMLAVEACVAAYARKYGEDEEKWAVTALLHDFDWEIHPQAPDHPMKGEAILRERGVSDEIRRAILSHANYSGVPRESLLEKTLFACDELAGFLTACAYVKPGRSIAEVEPKSVQVAFRDLSASSLDVWLAYEARDPDFRRWLQLRQEVNLALLRLVAARGLTFAYPTQTLDVAGAVLDRLAARPGPAR